MGLRPDRSTPLQPGEAIVSKDARGVIRPVDGESAAVSRFAEHMQNNPDDFRPPLLREESGVIDVPTESLQQKRQLLQESEQRIATLEQESRDLGVRGFKDDPTRLELNRRKLVNERRQADPAANRVE